MTRFPSGWWILTAAILGAPLWWGLITLGIQAYFAILEAMK